MARSRNIKPGFFKNEELVELPYETRLLFIGLWTIADRKGRLEDRPKRIKMELFAADNLDTDACLNQLQDAGFILRYERDGARYIQVVNFDKHQNPHKAEQPSAVPAPDGYEENPAPAKQSTAPAPDMHGATSEVAGLDSLIPDSLNTDSGIPDSLGENAPASAKQAPDVPQAAPRSPKSTDKRGTRLDESFELTAPMRSWAVKEGLAEDDVGRETDKFRDYWIAQPGQRGVKLDWQGTWRNWIRRAVEDRGKFGQPANMTRVSAPSARMTNASGQRNLTDEELMERIRNPPPQPERDRRIA